MREPRRRCARFDDSFRLPSRAKVANAALTSMQRRRFLQAAAALPLSMTAPGLLRGAAGVEPTPAPAAPKKYPIGLELYSVRGELQKDLPKTLRRVAEIGYEVVEFYSPYFAWTFPFAKQVRAQLDDLGLRCFSTHNGFASLTPGETMAKAIELNQILGARHIIMASPPPGTTGLEAWKRVCGQLTTAVNDLKPHGLSAGFHNHRIEWTPLEGGQRVMDVIAANTPPEFILQFDVGTCLEAGADPLAWIRAHPGRIKSVHLKDWAPGDAATEKGYRVLFGEGVAPWQDILAAVENGGGVEFYLMEQEGSRFPEFETAQHCLETWRTMTRNTGRDPGVPH
jgi:sugar phosphate isomerase/epimerase